MPRGYRCILVAFVGVALTGAAPPKEPAKKQQAASEQAKPKPPPPAYKPYPRRHEEACYESADHEAADLCAQWSAADAAQETASLSYAGNWISAFGALLSFLSVILVLLALRQGREANRIAAEGAKDADEALAHSRKVALAELRPWVVYNGLECSEAERGVVAGEVIDEKFLIAFLKFVNSGKTPANNCRMWSALLVTGMDDPAPTFEPVIDEIKRTVLAPNFPLNTATCIIRPAEFADVIAHRSCFWLYGYARYEDPTEQGNTYETETTVRVTFSGLQRLPDGREYPNFFGVPEGPQNRMT